MFELLRPRWREHSERKQTKHQTLHYIQFIDERAVRHTARCRVLNSKHTRVMKNDLKSKK